MHWTGLMQGDHCRCAVAIEAFTKFCRQGCARAFSIATPISDIAARTGVQSDVSTPFTPYVQVAMGTRHDDYTGFGEAWVSGVLVWQLTSPITSLFSQEMHLLSASSTKSRRNLEH
jgi:hypothetical protein